MGVHSSRNSDDCVTNDAGCVGSISLHMPSPTSSGRVFAPSLHLACLLLHPQIPTQSLAHWMWAQTTLDNVLDIVGLSIVTLLESVVVSQVDAPTHWAQVAGHRKAIANAICTSVNLPNNRNADKSCQAPFAVLAVLVSSPIPTLSQRFTKLVQPCSSVIPKLPAITDIVM